MSLKRRIGLTLLCWAVVSLLFAAVEISGGKPVLWALFAEGLHFGLWLLALPILVRITDILSIREVRQLWKLMILLPVVTFLAHVVMVANWTIVYEVWWPHRDNYASLSAMFLAETTRFLPYDMLAGLALVIAIEARRSWLFYQAEKLRAADLERQLAGAHLEALRMQLHPHFLFNTLHNIAGLIAEQPPVARRMVVALGDFLRLTLKDSGRASRSLAEELEFSDLYLGIEKLRLGDRLALDYDIEPAATAAEVPQLLLQPLFENAIRHGVSRLSQPCAVRFQAQRQGNRLALSLVNDGPPGSGEPNFGLGLTNTKARLKLHYGEDFTFRYQERPQGGAQIDISIPYRRAGDENADH